MIKHHRTCGASTLTCCRSDVLTNRHSFFYIFVTVISLVSLLECTITQHEAGALNGPVSHPSQLGNTTQHLSHPLDPTPRLQPTSSLVCCKTCHPTRPPNSANNRTNSTRCPGQRSHLKGARMARGLMLGGGKHCRRKVSCWVAYSKHPFSKINELKGNFIWLKNILNCQERE